MIVIADTTPINYLLLLGRAEALQQLYGRVIVPAAVLAELQVQAAPPFRMIAVSISRTVCPQTMRKSNQPTLQGQIPTRALFGPGVKVAAGGGQAGVAERRLHQVDGRAPVERVRGVRVPQPVR
jgi:hypothetical protein